MVREREEEKRVRQRNRETTDRQTSTEEGRMDGWMGGREEGKEEGKDGREGGNKTFQRKSRYIHFACVSLKDPSYHFPLNPGQFELSYLRSDK